MNVRAQQQVEFLDNLQRILNEGSFVASYKYALIRVLADLSIEHAAASDGRLRIHLSKLAERFVESYWRQVAPYRGDRVLLQNTGSQAAVINQIAALRGRAGRLSEAKRLPDWRRLVRKIEQVLLVMPLWRLQRVGDELLECFYPNRLIDGGIELKPGIAWCFASQFQVVQALVQLSWLRFVQQLPQNRDLVGRAGDLADFLFGADRSSLTALTAALSDLQGGSCFYCAKPLRGADHVDHFIPWVRYPRDLGHNFVVVHGRCNEAKKDRLADVPHLERWLGRNQHRRLELDSIFQRARMLHDAETTKQVAEWSYESVERAGGLVWSRGDDLVPLSRDWRRRFDTAAVR